MNDGHQVLRCTAKTFGRADEIPDRAHGAVKVRWIGIPAHAKLLKGFADCLYVPLTFGGGQPDLVVLG
ncbi:MAG: hypothetical protein L3J87_00260 [Thermoplasmata archaeon]|nr:hypothetical protein [Thermoplasmata archaeon]